MGIRFDENRKLFILETRHTTYQMKINEIGVLEHVYYGARVGNTDMSYRNRLLDRGFSGNPYEKRQERSFSLDQIPQEYSGSGVGDYRIHSIELVAENGSRSCDLRYRSHRISPGKHRILGMPSLREYKDKAETLELVLSDGVAGVEVTLIYGILYEKDVISRSAVIRNTADTAIMLEKAASVCMELINRRMDFVHFYGKHCMERQMERVELSHDIHVIGSNRGMSSHHHNPFCILCSHDATEYAGDCYGFMLMYSGNHKTEAEKDQAGNVRLVMGIGTEDFRWKLEPGAHFDTPEVILTFSDEGFHGLSERYHRVIRENVCDSRYLEQRRPVLLNNWEATYFDFDTEKIIDLAKEAAALGIEMLVLDDGWFGERNDDNTSLGDWIVNGRKLPGGLKTVSDEIHRLGMKFGLWFEPEMVSEDSWLYRTHPDWALKEPGRRPTMSRNQMVLDLSRKEVQDYLYDAISRILDSTQIEYIKWDFNRSLANVYSNARPAEQQGETAHRFVLGTYALLERLTSNYPDIMIEGCAGGGGRFDAGMLYYCPQIWCSDDTDPIARLKIQKGTSYGYPVSTMGSHVSASPNHQTGRETPLKTRGVVAMSGTFGYELNLHLLSKEEKEEIRQQIQRFHKDYWLIQKGIYHRLTDEFQERWYTAWEIVSEEKDKALVNLVVTDVQANPEFPYVKLKGLKKEGIYRLEETGAYFDGAALMNGGYTFEAMTGVYPSVQLHFTERLIDK